MASELVARARVCGPAAGERRAASWRQPHTGRGRVLWQRCQRFNTSRCRGEFQKMASLASPSQADQRHLARPAPRSSWRCRMVPSVCPDGRPSKLVWKISFDTGRAAHFRAVAAQRGALTQDVRAMAPTSSRWPIWPDTDHARPCKCHGTMVHVTAAATGVC